MNCKTCGYALWNLRARVCPECGQGFSPADFEFAPTSVKFCCPHCNQEYYGTDAQGHLVPREFECVTCTKPITMDEMVVLPAQGLREADTAPYQVPWLVRLDKGRLNTWLRTVGWGFGMAPQVGRSLGTQAGAGAAFSFGSSVLFIMVLLFAGWFAAIMFAGNTSGGFALQLVVGAGVSLLGSLAVAAALLGIVIAMAHGVLRMMGEGARGMGRSTEAIAYTTGPMLTGAVPCMGIYILPLGWIWWMVSSALALAEAQKARTWKCFVAMAVPGVVLPGIPIASVFISVFSSIGAFSAAMPPAGSGMGTDFSVTMLGMAWRSQAAMQGGPVTAHGSAFMTGGFVTPSAYLTADSTLSPADVPIGSHTLADFFAGALSPAQQQSIDAAGAALSPATIAHRVGDMVFTYHGVDRGPQSDRLWIVIAWPDRTGAAALDPTYEIVVGRADGETRTYAVADFPAQLQSQNMIRAQQNLPPLPMPDTITQQQPALAPER